MFLELLSDSLNETYRWDAKSKRYRDRISGTYVSRSTVVSWTQKYLEIEKEKFVGLAAKVKLGKPPIERELAESLRKIHVANAIVAANGIDKLSQKDLGKIGAQLKIQYYAGRGEDGSRFGLKYLLQDAKNQSEAQITQRLNLYAQSGEITGNTVRQDKAKESGMTLMKRSLGSAHQHCPDCVSYASAGWVGIGKLPLPKQKCICGVNCKCTVEYSKQP